MKYLLFPTPKDVLDFVEENHRRTPEKTILFLIGDCRIDYTGRAKSVLGFGERIVLVKHDGTVIVHRGTMREPVNWQPPDTRVSFEFDQDYFIISTRHYKPREKMKIFFRDIKMILATPLRDVASIRITDMEKDFTEKIIDDPNIIEGGLRIIKQEKNIYNIMLLSNQLNITALLKS